MRYRIGKYTVCGRVHPSSRQEILQAVAVKGLISCVKFGLPYLGENAAAARAALPIFTSVCQHFRVCKQWWGCQCLDFYRAHRCWYWCWCWCWCMRLHTGAARTPKRVCTESWLWGIYILCWLGNQNYASIANGFSNRAMTKKTIYSNTCTKTPY